MMSDQTDTAATKAVQAKLNYIDEAPLPEWGTGPDGRWTRIDGDDRLPALFDVWQRDACDHSRIHEAA